MRRLAWVAALAALWLPPLLRFSRAWSIVPEENYGWGVPLLAALLAWERWRRRPAPRPPGPAGRRAAVLAAVLGAVLLLAALPVLEANELWPTAQWAAAAGAGLATLAGLALAGGGAWAAHFAFPVAFVFTGLIWPTPVHLWVVQDLAGANARMAASLVSLLGHPAVVSGNVITVSTGLVGIDEACSGLRSLGAVWMAAWFFGEFFLLNWPRRLALAGASVVAALAANLARTSFLTWEAAAHGLAACERWHDAAGGAELAAALAAVALLAWRAARRSRPTPAEGRPAAPAAFPLRWCLGALAAGLLAELGTQAWYGYHEWRSPKSRVHWTLAAASGEWGPAPVPARAQQVLGDTEAAGLGWSDPVAGLRAWAFVVAWRGDDSLAENPEWHDPTICLPSAGVRLVRDLGRFPLVLDGVRIVFAGYRFAVGNRPLVVYFCHWDAQLDRARSEAEAVDLRVRRLERVRDGRRRGDVAHITLEIEGADDVSAGRWFEAWAPRLLRSERR